MGIPAILSAVAQVRLYLFGKNGRKANFTQTLKKTNVSYMRYLKKAGSGGKGREGVAPPNGFPETAIECRANSLGNCFFNGRMRRCVAFY